MSNPAPDVAIVDYGMGNLFSVKQACAQVGLEAQITSDPAVVRAAPGVILPGIGAFGDAMATLRRYGLAEALREAAASGRPLFGVCLGMQMLMTESHEFGRHEGLGLIPGDVVRLQDSAVGIRKLKVPQIGWNSVRAPGGASGEKIPSTWWGTLLEGLPDGMFMYFVHSFYTRPADPQVVVATTCYGPIEFCSALRAGNIFACQFHPERSGPQGLRLYAQFAARLPLRRGRAR